MLTYPNIDPIAFNMGPLTIRWYGVMHLLGFILIFLYLVAQRNLSKTPWTKEAIIDLIFYGAIGVVFGGTIGYWLFYNPSALLSDPLLLFKFWLPGRSFHGGILGVILALYIYSVIHHRKFLEVTDFIAPAVPIGLGLGRLGNFFNQELWGRISDLPWAMQFPLAGSEPRHPSQLYEFFLEGVVLFIILHLFSLKKPPVGSVSGLFAFCYGLFRIFVEFFREPDRDQGFLAWDWLTMGQLLSFPLVIIGLLLMFNACKNACKKKEVTKSCINI